jgi:hypothetical protein
MFDFSDWCLRFTYYFAPLLTSGNDKQTFKNIDWVKTFILHTEIPEHSNKADPTNGTSKKAFILFFLKQGRKLRENGIKILCL